MNTPNEQQKPTDGGSAFPVTDHAYISADGKEWHRQEQVRGISVRDYFAAKAMQSLTLDYSNSGEAIGVLAAHSYDIADAMLREREKQSPK